MQASPFGRIRPTGREIKMTEKYFQRSGPLTSLRQWSAVALLLAATFCTNPSAMLEPALATCGGGGGGGTGGMDADEEVYDVAWQEVTAPVTIKDGLIVYWLPATATEQQFSSLLVSRMLSIYSARCVTLAMVAPGTEFSQKLAAGTRLPLAILMAPDGTTLGKAENIVGILKVEKVEQLLTAGIKKRQNALQTQMTTAAAKEKTGDKGGAITIYQIVLRQKCLLPKLGKDAAQQLKRLGVSAQVSQGANLDQNVTSKITTLMAAGLKAELSDRYIESKKLYFKAHQLDVNDPAPLRYLGELYRHDIGDWGEARRIFEQILAMPSDPLSRAVALHGLGKITIHEGNFKKGLALMEKSVQVYPLALAYRNLAVYWNSEGDSKKAYAYTQKALAMAPQDPFNLVFSAVFMAASGHKEEALKVARENEKLMCGSYNLAAIYAQSGNKEKALQLLRRHFFEYERFQAVRSKEMMEARVDHVFDSLKKDKTFLSLTAGADGKLKMH